MIPARSLRRGLFSVTFAILAMASSARAQDDAAPAAGDPWVGYALTVVFAGAGIFLVCKSARRS